MSFMDYCVNLGSTYVYFYEFKVKQKKIFEKRELMVIDLSICWYLSTYLLKLSNKFCLHIVREVE